MKEVVYTKNIILEKLKEAIENKDTHFILPSGNSVKVSRAHKTFYFSGTECVGCGLDAQVFIEYPIEEFEGRARLNLFAYKNKQMVLMTSDHIIPASKGGASRISNLQTMCIKCNGMKKNNIKEQIIEKALYPFKSVKDFILSNNEDNDNSIKLIKEIDILVFSHQEKLNTTGPIYSSYKNMKYYLKYLEKKYGVSVPIEELKIVPSNKEREAYKIKV